MKLLPVTVGILLMTLMPHGAAAAPGKPAELPGQVKQVGKSDPPGQARESPAGPATDKVPPGPAKKDDEPPGPAKDNVPPGQAKGHDEPAGPAASFDDIELDIVRRAVENNEALPLAQLVRIVEAKSTGRVIDAQLLTIQGVLLYRLTLLDEAGRTWREYFVARTGNPVKL